MGHNSRLYLATVGSSFGAGFLIYSTYVTNNLQIVGEQWFNSTHIEKYGTPLSDDTVSFLWACLIASKEVGKTVGALFLPVLAERLGRRGGMLAMCLVTFIGCLLCFFGYYTSYHAIFAGRLLLGISMICGVGLCSMFLVEVAPLSSRGVSGSLIQIFRGLGGTMGMVLALPELLGTPTLWTLCLSVPLVPAAVQFVILLSSMESPRHLFITEGDVGKATRAIRFYQGSKKVPSALSELGRERSRIAEQRQTSASGGLFKCLTSPQLCRPLLLTTLALTNRSLAGILPVQSYSTDMFIATGMSHHVASYSTVALGVCHLISATTVTFTVERCDRRPMLIFANVGCLLTLLLVSFFSSIHTFVPWAKYAAVFSLGLFMLIYPVVASVSNIVASEICHQRMRSYAFTLGLLGYSLVGFASTFVYPLLKRHVGLSASFTPFCLCLILTVLVYAAWLPETRGKTFGSVAFNESAAATGAPDVETDVGSERAVVAEKKNGLIKMATATGRRHRAGGYAAGDDVEMQQSLLTADDDEQYHSSDTGDGDGGETGRL